MVIRDGHGLNLRRQHGGLADGCRRRWIADVNDDQPLPDRTWQSLKKVPPVILGMGGLMTGLHLIFERRNKTAAEAASKDGGRDD